jgi:hypothetical protein
MSSEGCLQPLYPSHRERVVGHGFLVTAFRSAPNRTAIIADGGDSTCDVCLLLNLGLSTEERARIVDHPYLLYVPPGDSVPRRRQRPGFRRHYLPHHTWCVGSA